MSERNLFTQGGNCTRMLGGKIKRRRRTNTKDKMRRQASKGERQAAARELAERIAETEGMNRG